MISKLIVLLMAIPVGYLIAWMARDELIEGRKWFRILVIVSVMLGVWFLLFDIIHISYSFFFISIVSFISLLKSWAKKWVGRRI